MSFRRVRKVCQAFVVIHQRQQVVAIDIATALTTSVSAAGFHPRIVDILLVFPPYGKEDADDAEEDDVNRRSNRDAALLALRLVLHARLEILH